MKPWWFVKGAPKQYTLLLVSLLLLLNISPLLPDTTTGHVFLDLLSSFSLLIILNTVADTPQHLHIGLLLGSPAFALSWLDNYWDFYWMSTLRFISLGLVQLYACSIVLGDLLGRKKMSGQDIIGAVSAYLLIGFVWAAAYGALQTVIPTAFRIDSHAILSYSELVYFSFSTMSSLGYGDVVPVHGIARNLAVLEGVVGQFFLAVLVGRVVGLHVAHLTHSERA